MNKLYKEKIGDIVACMIEGVGLVIGKVADKNVDVPILKNPRVVQTTGPEGPVQLRFGEMVGSPDELALMRTPVFFYNIKDKKIQDLYLQSTTGLALVNNLPT